METETTLKLAKGLSFASIKHKGQPYGNRPYTAHLIETLGVALEFGVTEEDILMGTLLHDTKEDTDTTFDELEREFGLDVAVLVSAVTNEPGPNRKERAKATYPKIRHVEHAVTLKLCDRIANLRNCWLSVQKRGPDKKNKSLLGMYKDEYGGFRKALRLPDSELSALDRALWDETDRLMAWVKIE